MTQIEELRAENDTLRRRLAVITKELRGDDPYALIPPHFNIPAQRARLFAAIVKRGEVSRDALSAMTGVEPATVKSHIMWLRRDLRPHDVRVHGGGRKYWIESDTRRHLLKLAEDRKHEKKTA